MASAILGSCVVFPEPVSPQTMMTWLAFSAAVMSTRLAVTGSDSGKVMAEMASGDEDKEEPVKLNETPNANKQQVQAAGKFLIIDGLADSPLRPLPCPTYWNRAASLTLGAIFHPPCHRAGRATGPLQGRLLQQPD